MEQDMGLFYGDVGVKVVQDVEVCHGSIGMEVE